MNIIIFGEFQRLVLPIHVIAVVSASVIDVKQPAIDVSAKMVTEEMSVNSVSAYSFS